MAKLCLMKVLATAPSLETLLGFCCVYISSADGAGHIFHGHHANSPWQQEALGFVLVEQSNEQTPSPFMPNSSLCLQLGKNYVERVPGEGFTPRILTGNRK